MIHREFQGDENMTFVIIQKGLFSLPGKSENCYYNIAKHKKTLEKERKRE